MKLGMELAMPDLDLIKQAEQGARDRRGRLAKGRSGNPAGRPRGGRDHVNRAARSFAWRCAWRHHAPELCRFAVDGNDCGNRASMLRQHDPARLTRGNLINQR